MANNLRDAIDIVVESDPKILARRREEERQKDQQRLAEASSAERLKVAQELSRKWGLHVN